MRWLATAAVLGACGRVDFDVLPDGGDGNVLALDPPASTMNTGSRLQLTARGGTPPYAYDLLGDGWVEAGTGLFVSPSNVGITTARVTDAAAATATAEVTYRGSKIFVVGGLNAGSPSASVFASTDGAAWALVGALPAPRENGALVVWNDRMLYIGGADGTPQTPIYASTDGATWTQEGNLPAPNVSMPVIVHRGALWMVSGYNGSIDHGEVRRSVDGLTWTTVGTYPTPRHEHDMVSRNGTLYVLGGHSVGIVIRTDIVSSDDGVVWQTSSTTLNFMADFQGAGQLGTRVVRTCGFGCDNVEASDDLIAWNTGKLPDGNRDGPSIVTLDGRMLMIGGEQPSVLASTDGIDWTVESSFVVPSLRRASAVVFTPP